MAEDGIASAVKFGAEWVASVLKMVGLLSAIAAPSGSSPDLYGACRSYSATTPPTLAPYQHTPNTKPAPKAGFSLSLKTRRPIRRWTATRAPASD
jgi:hypothetical protein